MDLQLLAREAMMERFHAKTTLIYLKIIILVYCQQFQTVMIKIWLMQDKDSHNLILTRMERLLGLK